MRRRSRSGLVFLLLCFNFILTYGQNISGKLVDNQTGNPHSGLMLTLENTNNVVFTNNSGNVIFVNVPSGNYNLLAKVSDQLFIISTFEYKSGDKDLGEIKFTAPVSTNENEFSVIDISDLAGIENENIAHDVVIYPNPIQSGELLNIKTAKPQTFRITNLLTILKVSEHYIQSEFSHFAAGDVDNLDEQVV